MAFSDSDFVIGESRRDSIDTAVRIFIIGRATTPNHQTAWNCRKGLKPFWEDIWSARNRLNIEEHQSAEARCPVAQNTVGCPMLPNASIEAKRFCIASLTRRVLLRTAAWVLVRGRAV